MPTRAEITHLANRYGYQFHATKEAVNPRQKQASGWILATDLQWKQFRTLKAVADYLTRAIRNETGI